MTISEETQRAYVPKEMLKELGHVKNSLQIGIPCESDPEKRLPITPEAVGLLTDCGHRIILQAGAGLGMKYADNNFSEMGASIVDSPAEVFQADIILKITPPSPEEVALMRPRTILFSMLQMNYFAMEAYSHILSKRISAFGYELIVDNFGNQPIRSLISEIDGMMAITIASELLTNKQDGKGILLGGIPGVPATEIVILGAGRASMMACMSAIALGAQVKVFDSDICKLRQLQDSVGQKVFTSNFHPNVLRNAMRSADVVIGALHNDNCRHHFVISDELICGMKKGAIIIDLETNEGGCFETTCNRSLSMPEVFERYGVRHYCRPNLSNYVARTTSIALSNILVPILMSVGEQASINGAVKADEYLRSGVYVYHGKPVNDYVSNHFNIRSSNLDIYLSAF